MHPPENDQHDLWRTLAPRAVLRELSATSTRSVKATLPNEKTITFGSFNQAAKLHLKLPSIG